MLTKSQRRGRPILLDFELEDDRRLSRYARKNGLKRGPAVRMLALRALAAEETMQTRATDAAPETPAPAEVA